jgi:mannitol-1-/sugar-/sorbitol-6-phosphatase
VLFDVDGTLLDSMPNLRRVWSAWADRHGCDPDVVWECAMRTVPLETFAEVAPGREAAECLAVLHELEDEDAREGECRAFAGAEGLLRDLPSGSWAVVTSNYAHRIELRFSRLGLPRPEVLVDAAGVVRGKPFPDPFLLAAEHLGIVPQNCLVVEDSPAGVQAALSAGMTVWAVNARASSSAAHSVYPTLDAAAPAIHAWLLEPPQA